MQFGLPCWKNFAKSWKVTAQIVKYKLENVFYQRSCFPWKQFCGHVECCSDGPVKTNLRGVPEKIHINPIKKPRNICSSDYRAWKDLRKNQKTICLNCEKHVEKCFFSKKTLPMKAILWTQRMEFWQTCQ